MEDLNTRKGVLETSALPWHGGIKEVRGRVREAWAISQVSYVTDLLEGENLEKKLKKVPISKDQAMMQVDPEKPGADQMKGYLWRCFENRRSLRSC